MNLRDQCSRNYIKVYVYVSQHPSYVERSVMGSRDLGSPSGGGLSGVFTPHNDGRVRRAMSLSGGLKS